MARMGIAIVQVTTGCLGLVAVAYLYYAYQPILKDLLLDMDDVASDVEIQLEIGSQVLSGYQETLNGIDRSLELHEGSIASAIRSSEQVKNSVSDWRNILSRTSGVTSDGSKVVSKFSGFLPLKVPEFDVKKKVFEFEVPRVVAKNETVQLPYPTATLGTTKRKIDLGLTDVTIDVPTIKVGRANKKLTVPSALDVSYDKRSLAVPSDIEVNYQFVLQEEKSLLDSIANEMKSASDAMLQSAKTLESVEQAIARDALPSLIATSQSLTDTRTSLARTREVEIPEFIRRLESQSQKIGRSRRKFRDALPLLDWLFGIVALIPGFFLTQGMINLRRSRNAYEMSV